MTTETERTGGFADAINSITETLLDGFKTLLRGRIDYSLGNYVHVTHHDTGAFNGHIAELPTSETVVVAREQDGVLVHVTRECVEGVNEG